MSQVVFDDIHYERREYDKWDAYGQAKTANILFSCAIEKRFAAQGIHAYAVHPGGIMTELGRHLQESDIKEHRDLGWILKDIDTGIETWLSRPPLALGEREAQHDPGGGRALEPRPDLLKAASVRPRTEEHDPKTTTSEKAFS